jgi:hypothetical protein
MPPPFAACALQVRIEAILDRELKDRRRLVTVRPGHVLAQRLLLRGASAAGRMHESTTPLAARSRGLGRSRRHGVAGQGGLSSVASASSAIGGPGASPDGPRTVARGDHPLEGGRGREAQEGASSRGFLELKFEFGRAPQASPDFLQAERIVETQPRPPGQGA